MATLASRRYMARSARNYPIFEDYEDCNLPECCKFCLVNPSQLSNGKGYCVSCEAAGIPGHPGMIYPKCGKCNKFHANADHEHIPQSPLYFKRIESNEQCPICYDTMNDAVETCCKHQFCNKCILTWYSQKKDCPVCRRNITS
jgi:hypothetical protein